MRYLNGGVFTPHRSWYRLTLRHFLMGAALVGAMALTQPVLHAQTDEPDQGVSSEEPPPPPPGGDDSAGAPPPDEGGAGNETTEVTPLEPGEAVVTRFSNTIDQQDETGKLETTIDLNGTSASIIDIRRPGDPPSGQHWIDEPQRMPVVAGEVGQVFGVAVDDAEAPDIFLSATAAFGLHRVRTGNGSDWMPGMWGPDAGPGTIYRLGVDNGFEADKFADVMLNGRPNSGAALGNIAYDRWHKQLFVSDLETGMIHRIGAENGDDRGHFDHGVAGRASFIDAWTGQSQSLNPVAFDPASSAKIDNCPGDFSKTPECWNLADFRRRIWGLGVRQGGNGETRLYYAVWGSDALGSPDWTQAGDDRRNAVWSVGINVNGDFVRNSVRREFFLPAFWPATPDQGDKAGNSNPVSDISFPDCGPQNVMVVAERGGMRNLGLNQPDAFARPHESRVLRYELGVDGIWRPKGRYDVGFYDRRAIEGAPFLFANSAGGADFGYGFDDAGSIDTSKPDRSLWMTGDALCSPNGACMSMETGEHEDISEVHGIQGSPADGFGPVEPETAAAVQPVAGKFADFGTLDRSYMVDVDVDVDENGALDKDSATRNDATRIGDVAIYEMCEASPPLPVVEPPVEGGGEPVEGGGLPIGPPPEEPPEFVAAHTLAMSHEKWASTGHNVNRSWHQRNASWHSVERSWHWKGQSWHSVNRSWHWRGGSWHDARRSWHWREGSWHEKSQSWHQRNQSFHEKIYSWHAKGRSWHARNRSYHDTARSWGNDHAKDRSWHQKDRSWGGQHVKGRTWHVKGQSWGGEPPRHVTERSYHNKGKTWGGGGEGNHVTGRSYHNKGKTWGGGGEGNHVTGRSFHNKGKTWGNEGGGGQGNHVTGRSFHNKGKTWGNEGGGGQGNHVTGRSFHNKGRTWGNEGGGPGPEHSKKASRQKPGGGEPVHTKKMSNQQTGGGGENGGGGEPVHTKKMSNQQTGGGGQTGGGEEPVHTKKQSRQKPVGGGQPGIDGEPVHTKQRSRQQPPGGGQPVHTKALSRQQTGGGQTGGAEPVHSKALSRQMTGGGQTGGQPVHSKVMSRQQSGGQSQGNQQPRNQGGGQMQGNQPRIQGGGQGSSNQNGQPVILRKKKILPPEESQ